MSKNDTSGDSDNHAASTSWDDYWAYGNLTSCVDAFPGNYDGRIREIWENFFIRLPREGCVLDIATGNGAIALLAAEYSIRNEREFEIHGIDRARISPRSAWSGDAAVLDSVTFHGQTCVENTGFPDAKFAAITGQYALEYTNISASLAELSRIMAPGAQGRFIMHHPNSVVIQTSREEISHGLLIQETRIFERAQALLRCIIDARSQAEIFALSKNIAAQRARDGLNEAAATISRAIEVTEEPGLLTMALGIIGRAIQQRVSLGRSEAFALLARGQSEIEANLERLADLLNAVVNSQKITEIQAIMRNHGLSPGEPQLATYQYEGNDLLMGWLLDFRRSA